MGFPEPLNMRPSMSNETGVFKTCNTCPERRREIKIIEPILLREIQNLEVRESQACKGQNRAPFHNHC
jgi:hypothetical protein